MTGQLGPWINDWNAEKLEVIDIAGGDACAIGERDTGDERVGNVTMTCRLNRSRAGNRRLVGGIGRQHQHPFAERSRFKHCKTCRECRATPTVGGIMRSP